MASRRCTRCGKNRQPSSFPRPASYVCRFCQKAGRRKTSRAAHVKRTYDITAEEAKAILEVQGGVCAGCREPRGYELPVDHDHSLERRLGTRASVRGRLCKRCNKVLRDVRDDPDTLRNLAEYLESPPARKVLWNAVITEPR